MASIPTPNELREEYTRACEAALIATVAGMRAANMKGQTSYVVRFTTDRELDYVAAKLKDKKYDVSIDHGDDYRGEFYNLLTVRWDK